MTSTRLSMSMTGGVVASALFTTVGRVVWECQLTEMRGRGIVRGSAGCTRVKWLSKLS